MKLTESDKKLMNDILTFLYESKGSWQDSAAARELNIDEGLYQFLLNAICELSKNRLNILSCEKFNDGSYAIVRFNKVETQRFLNNGGFLSLNEQEPNLTHINFIGGDNYGIQSSGSNNPIIKQANKFSEKPLKSTNKNWYSFLINPWFIGISLVLITAIFNTKRIMNFLNQWIDSF